MAKVNGVGVIICFSIVILFNFIKCSTFEESIHFRHKRQVTDLTTAYKSVPASTLSNVSPTVVPANQNLSQVESEVQGKDAKQNPPENNDSGGPSTENSITIQQATVPLTKEKPLLGVNGTGQRKDYSLITPKPAVVSDPIPPPKTTKLSTPKKVVIEPKPVQNEELIDTIDRPEEETQKQLNENNIIKVDEDHHLYYNSSTVYDADLIRKYWNTFNNITPNTMLSKSHRRAMTVQLSFEFPFYGHPVNKVTVATGGFLYTGDYVHSWLAATQYIAPLMANFDTSLSNDSYVKYVDNGTSFTVIWENVSLQDKQDVGSFTFSATLCKNGDIIFMYFSVPISIETIGDEKHPVKVGLSDAYIIDKVIFFARRKTIYEYHRVNFANQAIKNSTIIYLYALPTCLSLTDCHSCLTQKINFNCTWCPTLNKCSTGTDRKRQDWLHKGCDRTQITDDSVCPALGEKGNNAAGQQSQSDSSDSDPNNGWVSSLEHNDSSIEHLSIQDKSVIRTYDRSSLEAKKDEETGRVGLVLGLMLPICLVMSALVWVLYAYRNPHTKSGQLLIQYRPSQWTWRRGEARYTAATIHM